MVGIILLKDYETGAYDKMRVTAYRGKAYADIGKTSDFASCVVYPDKKQIVWDLEPSGELCGIYMKQCLKLCSKAREFFYRHNHVTAVEFRANEDDIDLRPYSTKSGIFAPVDFRGVAAKECCLYELCRELDGWTPLQISALCRVLNYTMSKLADIEDEVFGFSGKGLYINTALFDVTGDHPPAVIPKAIRTFRKKPLRIKKSLGHISPSDILLNTVSAPHVRLVKAERRAMQQGAFVAAGMPRPGKGREYRFAFDLASSPHIEKEALLFADEVREYVSSYAFCFQAISHIDYITTDDAYLMAIDIDSAENIAKKAAALSANMKLRDKLPCPDYYDSRGRGYNK